MHYVTRPSEHGPCLPDAQAPCECTKEQTATSDGSTRQTHRSDTNGCLCRHRARRSAALPATYLGAVLHRCTRPATTTQEARSCTHRYPSHHGSPRHHRLHTREHCAPLVGSHAIEPGVCAPHSTPARHRQRPVTPRPGTTARDRRAALRARQRHTVRPRQDRLPAPPYRTGGPQRNRAGAVVTRFYGTYFTQ